jgi:hypothetical protein
MAGADWNSLRQSSDSATEGTEWTASQYDTLVNLIKHVDDQLGRTNRYHLLAIGAMIPILAVLLKLQLPLYTHLGLMSLGVALGVRWLTLTSKLNLEKLCWISLARQVEKRHFSDGTGPFSAQQTFFSDLPAYLSTGDRLIMRRIGTRRLYFLSVIFVAFALVAGGLAALGGLVNLPF